MSERLEGKIVFFSAAKQFGFVKPDNSEGDVFFHLNEYDDARDPRIGDRVEFTAEPDPRHEGRRRAKAVTPIQN